MDKEIIKLNAHKSNIHNSPLLQGAHVEVKDYSKGLNTLKKTTETVQQPQAPEQQAAAKNQSIQAPPEQKVTERSRSEKKQWDGYDYQPPQPQPQGQGQDYSNDNTQEMNFGEEPEKQDTDDSDLMSPTQAKAQAAMMINMYSAFVPPALSKMLKKDVGRVKSVLSFNKVPPGEIQKIENFLNTQNSEIAKALQLTKEQVAMLKEALSAVLERYKLAPDNPVINLLIVVFGIAVTQFMAVTAIIRSQHEQIIELIEARNLTAPDGYEDFAQPQGLFKKKVKIRKAA